MNEQLSHEVLMPSEQKTSGNTGNWGEKEARYGIISLFTCINSQK